jgi:hypothetical protein
MDISASQLDDLSERYDTKVDAIRLQEDFMWKFMSGDEKIFQQGYLEGLYNNLIKKYGNGSQRMLPPDILETFRYIVYESKDINLKHAFWFFGMYLEPSIFVWYQYGNPEQGIPAPKLTDHKKFISFMQKTLPSICEEYLSGSNDMTLLTFVRKVRTEYFVTVGVYSPGIDTRIEHERAIRAHESTKQKEQVLMVPAPKEKKPKTKKIMKPSVIIEELPSINDNDMISI